jgi:serine O-acetyltransferase
MLKKTLYADLKRQYELEGCPATPNLGRLVFRLFHPRFLPVVICRVGRAAFVSGIPVLPQLCTYVNLIFFGLEVTVRCEIGPGLFFPHTVGTVVGAVRIGKNATIYQNVTLGSKILDMRFDAGTRPEIGDFVTLGAGCKVLGGIRIGDGAVVAANAVVLKTVEANSLVAGVPAQTIHHN